MSDDHHRQVQLAHQATQQVEQARLNGDIEAPSRLVHKHQARRGDQVAGDLQALLHATGEGARQVVDTRRVDLHLAQPVEPGGAQLAVVTHALGHQPLADIGAGRHRHAQAVTRVLLDEAPLGAQQRAPLGLAGAVQVEPLATARAITDRTAIRRAAPGEQTEQGGLARAGLADDAQHLAGIEVEAHALAALVRAVQAGQVARREQRLGRCHDRLQTFGGAHCRFSSVRWRQ